MSIQSEIDRIKKNVDDTLGIIGDTGVTVGAGSEALPAAARALATEKQDKDDAVSVNGGASLIMAAALGSAPFTIEMTDEDEAPISLVFGAQSVAASAFASDATYDGWAYRASVALPGVTADYVPSVNFSMADATDGNLAPVSEAYAGGVYIYAKEQPGAAVSIASVVCVKEV